MADFSIPIDGQDDLWFLATAASPNNTENLVGVITNDRHTLYFADSDGYASIQLVSSNVTDFCYLLTTADAQVAACTTFSQTQ